VVGNPDGLVQETTLLSGRWFQWLAPTQRPLWGALLIVLLLHWAVLSGWLVGASGKPPSDAPAARLIQFREVTLPNTEAAPAPSLTPTPVPQAAPTAELPAPPPLPREATVAPPTPEAPPTDTPITTAAPEIEPIPVAQAASEAASAVATEAPVPLPTLENASADTTSTQAWPGVDSDAPLYRVALPPGFKQAYVIRWGVASGTAELSWAPAGGRYELRLQGNALGFSMTQHSQGRFDVTGLEPERFTAKTPRGAELAVNFQREPGFISFSGVNRRFAWRLGAQDRLSVLIQLPAILAAEASRLAPGQRFGVPVVSERGDAEMWTFRIVGKDTVSIASGDVTAWRVVREQRKPSDRGVELWLDEQRHYLPVRLRFGNENERGSFELLRD
jgi:hypothetical protein